MAAEIGILEASGVFALEAGEAIKRGDLLYYSQTNSDWRKADANGAAETLLFPFAEMVAVASAAADGDTVLAAKYAVLEDRDDNAFSSNKEQELYLSATAGAFTETRPTGANDLKQRVGKAYRRSGGTGATIAIIDLNHLREETIQLTFPYTAHAPPVDRDNDYLGLLLDDTDAEVGTAFMVPENATGRLIIAYLWWCGTGTVLDTGDTYTFDATAAVDDETTSAKQAGIGAAALTVAANDLARATVSAGLNIADFIEPGNMVGIAIKKAAEGSTGDDPIMLGMAVVLEVC